MLGKCDLCTQYRGNLFLGFEDDGRFLQTSPLNTGVRFKDLVPPTIYLIIYGITYHIMRLNEI